ALIFETWDLSLLANCCEPAGRPDEAFDLLTRALDIAETRNERFVEAELHRRKGEWLLAHRRSELAETGLCFQRALAVAQKQDARTLQLRAARQLGQASHAVIVLLKHLPNRAKLPADERKAIAAFEAMAYEIADIKEKHKRHALRP